MASRPESDSPARPAAVADHAAGRIADRLETGAHQGPGRPGDLTELANAIHGDEERMRSRARSTPAPVADPRHSSRAVDAPIARLSAHMSVAETILYPAARRALPDQARWVDELYAGNREIMSVLRAIEQILYGDARLPRESFEDLVTQLDEQTARLDDEENRLVADLEAALGPERSALLAEQLRDGLAHAPTRPHPHLPHGGPLAKAAMRLLSRWDHLLDALNAREGAGVRVRVAPPPGLWGSYLLGRPAAATAETAAESGSTEVAATQPTSAMAASVEPMLPGTSAAGTGGARVTFRLPREGSGRRPRRD
jgi:hypothetical protein